MRGMLALPPGVRLGVFDEAKLRALWEKIKPYDPLFTDDSLRDPEVFLRWVLDRHGVVLELEGGIIIIQKIAPTVSAEAHFIFWDHKMSARLETLKDVMVWAFLTFELERMSTTIADYAKAVRRFVEKKMGWVYEGTKRNCIRHQGRMVSMHMYSILKTEVF